MQLLALEDAEYVPAKQLTQAEVPELAPKVPAAQLEQTVAPSAEYEPEAQMVQLVWPTLPWKYPMEQLVQPDDADTEL